MCTSFLFNHDRGSFCFVVSCSGNAFKVVVVAGIVWLVNVVLRNDVKGLHAVRFHSFTGPFMSGLSGRFRRGGAEFMGTFLLRLRRVSCGLL